MFKLYRKLRPLDWINVVLIIGLTIFQVYCTMTLVDYMQGIIKSITFLNYHNNPDQLGDFGKLLSTFVSTYGWDNLKNIDLLTTQFNIPRDQASMIVSIANASPKDIWYNGAMMLLCASGSVVAQLLIAIAASFVSANLSTNIRTDLYNKVQSFSLAEINKFSTPSLITRTTNDIQQVQMANLMMMRMIFAAPVTAIWAIVKIQASSTELTIATSVAIFILVLAIVMVMLLVLPKFKLVQKYTDKLNGVTRENLTGIRVIRAYNAEEYQENKFDKTNSDLTKLQLFTGKVMALLQPFMSLIMNGIALAIYWIGASLINNGTIDYATVTSFMMLSSQIIMAFVMLMMMFILWPRATVSAKRINEVLETVPSINDSNEEKELTEHGTIEFNDVSFKFPDGDNLALSNISFKVKQGETIAFIGATGAGKTTLINLMPRLYDVTSGEIKIDGQNIKDVSQKTLHSLIGYVPQKGILFRGTVKENIAFGNKNLDDEEIIKAATIAEANDFIQNMENGYNSIISQGGKNVSGGQKQRLCIARALAIKPEILIFDDSFSALDYKTDRKLRDNLKKEYPQATKVIVAQRIGTIIDANKIVVLDDGKIVGIGDHKSLLSNCKIYREIALSQLSKEELGI